MNTSQARQLDAHRSQIRQLVDELSHAAGFISSGSLVQRLTYCGTPTCRCHGDPPQPHGPYWQWTYRPTGGKTVTRQVGERQAALYREWIANRRRLLSLIDEMEEVSRQAAEILLADPPTTAPGAAAPAARPTPVTRHLAQAVAQLAELIDPVAEAAQEWLESNARERLLTVLGESPDLASTSARLARLLGTAAWPR
jgi:hypothetical protein